MNKLDKNFRPQDNFFRHVNNNWLKQNPIPGYASSWGTFSKMSKETSQKVNLIINELMSKPSDNIDIINFKKFIKTAKYYSRFKDNNLASLKKEIEKVNNIKNLADLNSYLGYAHRIGISVFWGCYVDVDDKQADKQVVRLEQAGLTMPSRDYYLDKTKALTVESYQQYFNKITKKIDWLNHLNWQNIYDMELFLARKSAPEEELRDVEKCYNHFSFNNLNKKWPNFNWLDYFNNQGWQPNDNIIINRPDFITACLEKINKGDLTKIKDYITWRIINGLINLIDKDFYKIKDDFFGKAITGSNKPIANYLRIIRLINSCELGNVLGQEFIKKHFSDKSKDDIKRMVDDIKLCFHNRINSISWMSQKTKELAHAKLDNIRVFIGYPDEWRTFNELDLVENNLVDNYLKLKIFDNDYELDKVSKPTNPNEWHMEAYTVNAYHDPNRLVICFPAGILQPPFYDPKADYATNLGGIGTIIGHELIHGFDDMGCKFDQYGNNKQWQTKSERQKFEKLTKPLIEQANKYEVLPGLKMNGQLVVGEIMADIGGVELAIEALKLRYKNNYQKHIKKLLINFATCECGKERKKMIYRMTKDNPHPISIFRVNITLMHVEEFYKAYQLTSKDKLFLPEDKRVKVW